MAATHICRLVTCGLVQRKSLCCSDSTGRKVGRTIRTSVDVDVVVGSDISLCAVGELCECAHLVVCQKPSRPDLPVRVCVFWSWPSINLPWALLVRLHGAGNGRCEVHAITYERVYSDNNMLLICVALAQYYMLCTQKAERFDRCNIVDGCRRISRAVRVRPNVLHCQIECGESSFGCNLRICLFIYWLLWA